MPKLNNLDVKFINFDGTEVNATPRMVINEAARMRTIAANDKPILYAVAKRLEGYTESLQVNDTERQVLEGVAKHLFVPIVYGRFCEQFTND